MELLTLSEFECKVSSWLMLLMLLLFFSHNFSGAATNFDRWKLISAMEWIWFFIFGALQHKGRIELKTRKRLQRCYCFVLFTAKWNLLWVAAEILYQNGKVRAFDNGMDEILATA